MSTCPLLEHLKQDAEELKHVVSISLLKLALSQPSRETFVLLGRRYVAEADPEKGEVTIRLFDPGGMLWSLLLAPVPLLAAWC